MHRALALAAILGVLAIPSPAVDPDLARIRQFLPVRKDSKIAAAAEPRRASRVVRVPDLHWAAIAGNLDEVRRLLNSGARLTAIETLWGGERALHWGAVGGNPGVVRALLAAGASIEARDDYGETSLRESLRADDPLFLALQALLVAGAEPEARSRSGMTALHEAVVLPSEHTGTAVHLLRMFGANPNVEWGDSKITPLHLAATQPYKRFSGWALTDATIDPNGRAADVNARDHEGRTALHWTIVGPGSAQDLQVAIWLIDNGADVNATDDLGATALDWAEAFGDSAKDIADLLRKAADVTLHGPREEP